MLTYLAYALLGSQREDNFRQLLTVGERKPVGLEPGYMLQYSGNSPDKDAKEYLSSHDWEIVQKDDFVLFVDCNTSQYGRLLKKFRFHQHLFNHFKKFPDGNGYASEDFSQQLRTIFSQLRQIPESSFANRVSISREVSIKFILTSKHRQEFGNFESLQNLIQQPFLKTQEPFKKIDNYWIPTWTTPKESSETFSRLTFL